GAEFVGYEYSAVIAIPGDAIGENPARQPRDLPQIVGVHDGDRTAARRQAHHAKSDNQGTNETCAGNARIDAMEARNDQDTGNLRESVKLRDQPVVLGVEYEQLSRAHLGDVQAVRGRIDALIVGAICACAQWEISDEGKVWAEGLLAGATARIGV